MNTCILEITSNSNLNISGRVPEYCMIGLVGIGKPNWIEEKEKNMKDFQELRNQINSMEKVDKSTLLLIESELGERKSMIINDVNFQWNGKFYLKNNASKWMKQMFAEIVSLEKACTVVKGMI